MGKLNWNPWMGLDVADDELERLCDDLAGRPAAACEKNSLWSPAADMVEEPDCVVIKADLPGLTLKDIALEFRDGELVIYGCRRFEKESGSNIYHVLERSYGPFSRAFPLPANMDSDSIRATLGDGVLTITVDRKKMRRRNIPVG